MNGSDVEKKQTQNNIDETVPSNNCNDIDRIIADNFPLTEETTCGLWIFRGAFLQK